VERLPGRRLNGLFLRLRYVYKECVEGKKGRGGKRRFWKGVKAHGQYSKFIEATKSLILFCENCTQIFTSSAGAEFHPRRVFFGANCCGTGNRLTRQSCLDTDAPREILLFPP